MSYLNPLRLHFSGKFQADVSTVNNDPQHYNNATFKPQYQKPRNGNNANGWWNPEGSGAWRLVDCKVTQVHYQDGTSTDDPNIDPAVGMYLMGADQRVAGKLVDLDPEQQLVSEIWGLVIRLADQQNNFFTGNYKVAAFSDIWWSRAANSSGGDISASAFYQSIIENISWADKIDSHFIQQLKDHIGNGALSIKFNVDGFNMNHQSADFTLGRIVGSIGPAHDNEPNHFIAGRQFMPQLNPRGAPINNMSYACAVVHKSSKTIIADFGNALPTSNAGGALADLGRLKIAYALEDGSIKTIAEFPNYLQPDWYNKTAGIVEFTVSDDDLTAIGGRPLVVMGQQNNKWQPFIRESGDGLYLRADTFVFRLNPGEQTQAQFYALKYGEALPHATLIFDYDDTIISQQVGPNDPPIGTPESALEFEKRISADETGRTTLTISGSDPGNPRSYIDGQVYGIGYTLQEILDLPSGIYNPDSSNFLSVLLWDDVQIPNTITWEQNIKPIFQQYANLYPLMDKLVDLSNYDAVIKHRKILHLAFGLERHNPNYMPVTRDLSDKNSQMILQWLSSEIPEKGVMTEIPLPATSQSDTPNAAHSTAVKKLGGKTMARFRKQGLPDEIKSTLESSD